jgi:hypothetical protein
MEKRGLANGILAWIIILGAIGSCLMCSSRRPIKDFKVEFHGQYSSSGGDRILDVVYTVRNGVVVSCTGTYSYPPSQDQLNAGIGKNNVALVDLLKLKNRDYNAPIVLISAIKKGQKVSDEVDDGRSSYRYRIILK